MFSFLVHNAFFFILSIIVSALPFESTDFLGNDLLFSDITLSSDQSAASLDENASTMFDLSELPASFNIWPLDGSAEAFGHENEIGNNDSGFQYLSSEDIIDMELPDPLSEPAHLGEEESYQDDLTPGSLIAAVDGTAFFPSDDDDNNAPAGASGEIADLSNFDLQLLRDPLGALIGEDRGETNSFCSLYTKTYYPIGICASNAPGNQVEVKRASYPLNSFAFAGFKVWQVSHATYGTSISSERDLNEILYFSLAYINLRLAYKIVTNVSFPFFFLHIKLPHCCSDTRKPKKQNPNQPVRACSKARISFAAGTLVQLKIP